MCGFVGIFDVKDGKAPALRKQLLQMSRRIRHRGPDWSGVFEGDKALISHERLAIIDPLSGKQPLYSPDGRYVLADLGIAHLSDGALSGFVHGFGRGYPTRAGGIDRVLGTPGFAASGQMQGKGVSPAAGIFACCRPKWEASLVDAD